MRWNALVPVVVAALVVPAGSTGRADAAAAAGTAVRTAARADAAGGTYRIDADGDPILGWAPRSGAVHQTSDHEVSASGTLVGDFGSAPYDVAAGPGIVRTKLSATFSGPGGFSNPFGPGTQAVSTTELTVSGDQTELNTSFNLHVDGFLDTPVCGGGSQCGALGVQILTAPFGRQAEFNTLPDARANSLGLAFDPVQGGFHVHGDVIGAAFGVRTNTPIPITIAITLGGRFGAVPEPSTINGTFDDPVRKLQVSFDPAKPVLNDIPAGFTVSGPSVVDNHWADPFAPSDDVVVTSCAALSQLTVVNGNLTIHNLAGCPAIAMPNLTHVGGDILIDGTDAAPIQVGPGVSVGGAIDVSGNGGDLTIEQDTVGEAIDVSGTGGDLTIEQDTVGEAIDVSGTGGDLTIDENTVGEAIDVSSTGGDLTVETNDVGEAIDVGGGTGGDLTIDENTGGDPIDVSGDVGGDLTIVDNGDAVVNAGAGQIGGNATIESAGDPVSGTTAGGSTSVTALAALATMHALLPAGAFDHPVAFSIARTTDTPPEAGTAPDGSPAQVDPIAGYRFSFAVPTLHSDAQLRFDIDLSQLDAVGRAELLDAIANGNGTIAVKGEGPNAAFHAFAQCRAPQVPMADGCVAVTLLDASGLPLAPGEQPALARFDGVVGHFSTYVVARVLKLDSTPPTITVPGGVTVDATGPSGASVRYAASARDNRDPAPSLTCAPASGAVFRIGDTTVVCEATDTSRNASTARFVVHVRGAGEQLLRLVDRTVALLGLRSLRPAIKAVLHRAVHRVAAKRPQAACRALHAYVAMVKRAPRQAFTPTERTELVADARQVEAVLGC
jgi:hypothetical protein